MTNENLFLAQCYNDAWKNYDYICNNPVDDNWDWVIVTASNEKQAQAYELQINQRLHTHRMPHINYMIIPDYDGKRIGSGGATLNALYELAQKIGIHEITRKKILLIHSGGDSKRIPQYSACGKMFAPIPRILPNGKCSTIFDDLFIALATFPSRTNSGLLIAPSDTEVIFNISQLDLFSCDGAGISIKTPVHEGVEHGVFVQSTNSKDLKNKNVYQFLHKKSEAVLRKYNAVDIYNNVDIDTGIIWLGKDIVKSLLELVCEKGKLSDEQKKQFINDDVCLNFYSDFVYPLAECNSEREYFSQPSETIISEKLIACRKKIWDKLHNYQLSLVRLFPAKYITFGMTHELYNLYINDIDKYSYLGWNKCILTNSNKGCIINSYIDDNVNLSESVFIEDSIIKGNSIIGEGCVLSGVNLSDNIIPDNVVLHMLKLKNQKYICRIYGREDNPKMAKTGSFLGSSLSMLMQITQIRESDLWTTSYGVSIWNAKLYSEEDTIERALESALLLYRIINRMATAEEIILWKNSTRYSLNESFNNADVSYIIERKEKIEQLICVSKIISMLNNMEPFDNVMILLNPLESHNLKRILSDLLSIAEKEVSYLSMRIYLLISDICKKQKIDLLNKNWGNFEDKAYEVIKKKITDITFNTYTFDKSIAKFNTDKICINLPARINFCGSPSDAAPYCLEHGGTMLDGAIFLNGKPPISSTITKLNEYTIVLSSKDQKIEKAFDDINDIRNCQNPKDAFALHKAVLLASGLIPLQDNECSLSDICQFLGGGFRLETLSEIPKGSGLGTSSIIAAACLKAINIMFNQSSYDSKIYSQVFLTEQLMNTGGGWQDQVGGLTFGIKYFRSMPGDFQNIKIDYVDLDTKVKKELNNRFALIFSGQRRLARNVLREELNQCIRNNSESLAIISNIRECCSLMRMYLESGNIDKFADLLTNQFELIKKLDQGASNTYIEYIFDVCDDLILGKSICGAGGGGFLQVILRSGVTKEQLRRRISEKFGDCGIEVWDSELV